MELRKCGIMCNKDYTREVTKMSTHRTNYERIVVQMRKKHLDVLDELVSAAISTRSEVVRDMVLYHFGIMTEVPPSFKWKKPITITPTDNEWKRVTVQLRPKHLELANAVASEYGITRSELIRDIILYYLGIIVDAPPQPKKRE